MLKASPLGERQLLSASNGAGTGQNFVGTFVAGEGHHGASTLEGRIREESAERTRRSQRRLIARLPVDMLITVAHAQDAKFPGYL